MDPEHNIKRALSPFRFNRKYQRSFVKKARKRYVVPDGLYFSNDSADLVINAYENNNLASLGMPYTKKPMSLDIPERQKLLELSGKVMETALLSKYNYKSFGNHEHFQLGRQSIQNIGKAYNISESADNIFQLEKIPNLKELFITEGLGFDELFKLRHTSNAKYFRKWINRVGENVDAAEITTEYLKEIKGQNNVTATEDKFMKTIFTFGLGAGLSSELSVAAGLLSTAGLSLLDNFWLDNLLKGKNPSMFIEDLSKEIK